MQRFDQDRPLVYIAAPLFSEAELAFNIALANRIEVSLDVYLPQRDGGKVIDLVASGVDERAAYKSIFERDIHALDASAAVIIVMDGRAIDEGAAFELGYAYAHSKQCFGLQTDPRRLLPIGNNPMITVPLKGIFASIEEAGCWADSFIHTKIGIY